MRDEDGRFGDERTAGRRENACMPVRPAVHPPLPDLSRRRLLASTGSAWAAAIAPALWSNGACAARPASTHDLTWHDSARSRNLPVRMRWPAGEAACPLVVYSHGLGGSREGGDAWGSAWADAGVAVLHVQHAGSDSALLAGGANGLLRGLSAQAFIDRIHDVRFVLDELARLQTMVAAATSEAQPWQRLRLERVGMAGHSFGARTTQALAGERYPGGLSMVEPRLVAFIALSPSLGRQGAMNGAMPASPGAAAAANGAERASAAMGTVTRPFLAVTGSHDGDPFSGNNDGHSRAQVYSGLPASTDERRALLWLDQADHMSFAGNVRQRISGRGPFQRHAIAAQQQDLHHARVATVTTWWWRRWLHREDTARLALQHIAAREQTLLAPTDRLCLG